MSGPVPESINIDDMQDPSVAPVAPNLADIKIDGEGVPDDLKGKSAAELVAYANRLEEALKTSERARQQSDQMASLAARTPIATVEAPKVEPELTDEQLATLYQDDPIKAIKVMQDQAARVVMKNIDSRMGSLFTSTAAMAENEARQKFKTEFDVLGSEISAFVKQNIPNAAQVLTDVAMWERVIAQVRGSSGNFEKLAQHYAGASAATPSNARAKQSEDAGISMTSTVRAAAPRSVAQLDDTQREIVRNLGISEDDYVKWSKV